MGKRVPLLRAGHPVPSTPLHTFAAGRTKAKHCHVTARSQTLPKARPPHRTPDRERPQPLVISETRLPMLERKTLFPSLSCRCLHTCQKKILLPSPEGAKRWAPVLHCNLGGPTSVQEMLHTDPAARLGAWINNDQPRYIASVSVWFTCSSPSINLPRNS